MSPSYQVPAETKPWKQVILRSIVLLVCCGLPALGIAMAFRLDAAPQIVEVRYAPLRFVYDEPHHVWSYRPMLMLTEYALTALIAGLVARDWYALTHAMPLLPRWKYGFGLIVGIALTLGMAFLWFLVIPFAG